MEDGQLTKDRWEEPASGMAGNAGEVAEITEEEGVFRVDLLDSKGRRVARSKVKIKGTPEEEPEEEFVRSRRPEREREQGSFQMAAPFSPPAPMGGFRAPRNWQEFMAMQEQEKTRAELASLKRAVEESKTVADQSWLQGTIGGLQQEINALRVSALTAEREAYRRGFEDGKEKGEGTSSGEIDFKGIGDVLKILRPSPQAIPAGEGGTPELDLRGLLALVLRKEITPSGAVSLIRSIFGEETKKSIAARKIEIFQEAQQDPELLSLANGENKNLLAELAAALDG